MTTPNQQTGDKDSASCCCCASGPKPSQPREEAGGLLGFVGGVDTPVGRVPQVATSLSRADRLGTLGVRLAIRRMRYAVEPGLYAVGAPGPEAPVLLSANYKLSFDRLRQELGGLDAWILVLDTKGINVWCAAGKGTFGTDEVVRRVEAAQLAEIVSHRTLIAPQLGAPGVAAHEVKKRSGFRVVYGPVRAEDIGAFLEAGMQATPAMRRVRFDLRDRLAVVPVEIVLGARHAFLAAGCLFLLGGLTRGGYDSALAVTHGGRAALLVLLAFLGGAVLTPALLPCLPGRAFSIKGAVAGLVLAGLGVAAGWIPTLGVAGRLEAASWLLLMPAAAAFLAMNFTGASTYTSLSGVLLEVRTAGRIQLAAGAAGLVLWLAARFA